MQIAPPPQAARPSQCFSTLAVKISILYSNRRLGFFCLRWSALRSVGLCLAGGFLRSSCPQTSPCWPRFHTPQHRRPCSSSACLLQGGARHLGCPRTQSAAERAAKAPPSHRHQSCRCAAMFYILLHFTLTTTSGPDVELLSS